MLEFDFQKIKENKYLIFCLLITIIFLIIVDLFMPKTSNNELKEEVLDNEKNNISSLVINEIMTSNGGVVADINGNTYDWIELYNGNNYDINITNYGLTDSQNTIKWIFPETIIKAKSYLIVYLSGNNQDGMYANFKLSSSGKETISLRNKNGKVVDAVEIVALEKNKVMARNSDGKWIITSEATPNYTNNQKGKEEYINSLLGEEDYLKITEVLPNNDGHFKDQYGNYSGYIELTNTSDTSISLKSYQISEDINTPFKWNLPDINLNAKETILIYTSGKNNIEKQIHANFKLESKTGQAILSKNGKIIDKIEYTNLANGLALVKEIDWVETSSISPGYANTVEGVKEFAKNNLKNNNSLIINEVMNNNSSYLVQNGGEYYDWIELKNNSDTNINLSEYYLTNNDNQMTRYKLPNITLKPNELYVVMASGDTNLSNSYYHVNFKLSDIEALYLTNGKDIIDSMFISDIPLNYSQGRNEEHGFFYFQTPTPNRQNGSGVMQVSKEVEVSVNSGVYNDIDGINLELKASGTIYYTLDGSVPNTNSNKYSGPLFITKTTVIRTINVENGKIVSPVTTNSYIINENHKLPVMSISMNPNEFYYMENNSWQELEIASYVDFFEGEKGFSIPCGFKMFGGTTRGHAKKSFALKFKKKYGESSLNYKVFDNRDFSIFNTLVIRSGSQDSRDAFLRDIFATSLMEESEAEVQSYKSIVLYINGKYWGVYNIREKVDDEFLSNHYNVDGSNGNIIRTDYEVSLGSSNDYMNVINYLINNDMSINSNYEYIKTKVNINSLIDFWIGEIYTTNNDIINSRVFSHPNIDNGKLHFIYYDLDCSLYFPMNDYYTFMINPEGMSEFKVPNVFMINMFKNDQFRKDFVERLSWNLKNIWNEENALNKLEEIYNNLYPEMERNQIRWGMTLNDWINSVETIRTFIKQRQNYLLNQTQIFFNLSNIEMQKYFGDL